MWHILNVHPRGRYVFLISNFELRIGVFSFPVFKANNAKAQVNVHGRGPGILIKMN